MHRRPRRTPAHRVEQKHGSPQLVDACIREEGDEPGQDRNQQVSSIGQSSRRYRTDQHILTPEADYEVSGHVPNVVFPCAALHDTATDRLAIYYGAADTSCCLAFAHLGELIAFVKDNSCVF